jgi:F-type H+-transporting ATPase subunit delta
VALAGQIREEFERLVDEHQGVAHAQVVTAVPLSERDKREVEERLSQMIGKKLVVEAEVDPTIMGGLVARIGDRLIDGSTRTRLTDLRRRLGGNTVR